MDPLVRRRLTSRTTSAIAALAAVCAACSRNSAPVTSVSPDCLIADNSAPAPDTLYVVAPRALAADSGDVTCNGAQPITARVPVVFAPAAADADLRDVLDRGLASPRGRPADVIVTRDPTVLAYAAQTGRYTTHALPWSRTYVLAVPGADSSSVIPIPIRNSLARDAVSEDARGASGLPWWRSDTTCAAHRPVADEHSHIIAYEQGDAVARQLAERIAALASSQNSPPWLPVPLAEPEPHAVRIQAVAADSIADALASGRFAAAVYSYSTIPPPACSTSAWVPRNGAVLPLVDTRQHALLRNGSGATFYVTPLGGLYFVSGHAR